VARDGPVPVPHLRAEGRLMRLVDLNPRWWADGDGRHGMGITFDCPGKCCTAKLPTSEEPRETPYKVDHPFRQRLGVAFANPVDGGVPEHLIPHHDGAGHLIYAAAPEWNRTGDTFEVLTLTPSVNAEPDHWHGFITNGEAR
jgi:hypothetical protein